MPLITIQPGPTDGKDTEIDNNNPLGTDSYGSREDFHAGNAVSAGKEWRSLIQFDLSSVPAGITVFSAKVWLYCWNRQAANTTDIRFHRSLVEWFEGSGGGGAPPPAGVHGSVWAYRDYLGSVAWPGGQGGGSGSSYAATQTAAVNVTNTATWYSWDITADVVGFLNGTYTNYGWFIKASNLTTNNRKFFYSSDHVTNTTLRPRLEIDYNPILTPAAASGVGSTAADAVVKGAAALTPVFAIAVGYTADPVVEKGAAAAEPTAAVAVGSTTYSVIEKGAVAVAPEAVSVVVETAVEEVAKGGVVVGPASAVSVGDTRIGGVIGGTGIQVSPDEATARGETAGPLTVKGAVVIEPEAAAVIGQVSGGVIVAVPVTAAPAIAVGSTHVIVIAGIVTASALRFKGMYRGEWKGVR